MNRRSFFGMFGALSAVTAAGIILPEPVKSYFFLESPRGFAIRQVRVYDVFNGEFVNRADVVRIGGSFPLDVPLHVEWGKLIEYPTLTQEEAVDKFRLMNYHADYNAFEALKEDVDLNSIRSVTWRT